MVAAIALEGAVSRGSATFSERKRQLHSHMQSLLRLKIGGTTIGDTGAEAGNLGVHATAQ